MRRLLSWSTPVLLAVSLACAHSEERAAEPAAAPAPTQAILLGTVVGADGKPLPMAHVHLGEQSFPVAADGTFRLELPPSGFAEVRFSGVSHAEFRASLWLDAGEHPVEVKLGTHPRAAAPEKVSLMVEKDGKLHMKSALPMVRREDGTFALTVEAPAGRFAYQLLHATTAGNTMNGTQADRFEYDGGGDYLGILEAPGGKLEVVYDPKKLPTAGAEVALSLQHPRDQRVQQLAQERAQHEAAAQEAAMSAMKEGKNPGEAMRAHLAAGKWAGQYAALAQAEEDPAVRQVLWVLALSLSDPGSATEPQTVKLADAALDGITPRSGLWGMDPSALTLASSAATDKAAALAYVQTVIESHPIQDVSAAALMQRMQAAMAASDQATAEAAFTELTTRFPESRYTFFAQRMDPTAKVRVGASIPAFSFPRYLKPSEAITPASLKGKTYLISLWASWCKPCIAKLPTLHALQKQYGPQGFTIVAVAIQDELNAIKTFRQDHAKQWPMPWENAYVPMEQADAVMKSLSAVGLPSSILVGPDGKVLATNVEVDKVGLEALVEQAMARPTASAQ